MRIFDDTQMLIEEIRRDIFKSPIMVSSRVQANEIELKAHEAMNYSYAIHGDSLPTDHYGLAKLGAKYFETWQDVPQMVAWLALEQHSRFQPLDKTSRYGTNPEKFHPILKEHKEGGHYAYTYRERMIGMLPAMESVLAKDLYSRRAYWPIFEQRDSHRASDLTRIPCSLGLHFAIREIALKSPQLHVTNYQRSCDFNKFFLSDLWFTVCAQRLLAKRLDVACGLVHHNILSLHAFLDVEIY